MGGGGCHGDGSMVRSSGGEGRAREPSAQLTCRRRSPGAERAPALPAEHRARQPPLAPRARRRQATWVARAPREQRRSPPAWARQGDPRDASVPAGSLSWRPVSPLASAAPPPPGQRPWCMGVCLSVCLCPHLHRARPPFVALPRLPRAHGGGRTPLCSGRGVSVCTRAGRLAGGSFEHYTEEGGPGSRPVAVARSPSGSPGARLLLQHARRIFTCVPSTLANRPPRFRLCLPRSRSCVHIPSCVSPRAKGHFFCCGGF